MDAKKRVALIPNKIRQTWDTKRQEDDDNVPSCVLALDLRYDS